MAPPKHPTRWAWRRVRNPWPGPRYVASPLADRYGHEVREVCRGKNGNVLWEFEDGRRVVAPRYAGRQIPGVALVRSYLAVAWELRLYWARGWRCSVRVDGDEERLEGHVTEVSPTNAYAIIGGCHVPLGRVQAVYRPTRLSEDTAFREGERWHGATPQVLRVDPRQLALPMDV